MIPVTAAMAATHSAYKCSFSDPWDFAYAPRASYQLPEHFDGQGCPCCGSDHVERDTDGEYTWLIECLDCRAMWREHAEPFGYTLVGDDQDDIAECLHTAEYLRERSYQSLVIASQQAYEALAGLPTERSVQDILDDLCSALNHAEDHGQSLPL